jgi:acetyl esterase
LNNLRWKLTTMPLAPEIEKLLSDWRGQPAMHQTPIAELRKPRNRIGAGDFQPVEAVEDRTIDAPEGHSIALRLYSPPAATAPLPLVVLMHGGGFVFGGIEGYYDHACRVLCAQAGCKVVSVGYRLAPEHKFPAAVHDCRTVLNWAVGNSAALGIDPARMIIAGGSAGANLAASTALWARDAGGPNLCGQILFYPMVENSASPTASMHDFAQGYYLTRADIDWFWQQYLHDPADARNPFAAPLHADSLANLAPALIITAEYDPLRDQGEQYARRLQDEGVDVTLSRYPGMVHGFMAFPTDSAAAALREGVAWIVARVKPGAPG